MSGLTRVLVSELSACLLLLKFTNNAAKHHSLSHKTTLVGDQRVKVTIYF